MLMPVPTVTCGRVRSIYLIWFISASRPDDAAAQRHGRPSARRYKQRRGDHRDPQRVASLTTSETPRQSSAAPPRRARSPPAVDGEGETAHAGLRLTRELMFGQRGGRRR